MSLYIQNDRPAKGGNGFKSYWKPNGGNGHAAKNSPGCAHAAPIVPVLKTGRHLSHVRLSATARAFLAADLVQERVRLVKPTIKQAAALARVSVPYVDLALAASSGERAAVEAGNLPLAGVGKLANAWNGASEYERLAFVRTVGTEAVWKTLSAAV